MREKNIFFAAITIIVLLCLGNYFTSLRTYISLSSFYFSDHGLKGKSWRRIALRMQQKFSEDFDAKSCRNKLNVLRYDYSCYKTILSARENGTDDESFWTDLIDKYSRATKWKDSPYPHLELMRKIIDENGSGVPSVVDDNTVSDSHSHQNSQPFVPKSSLFSRKRQREEDYSEDHQIGLLHGHNNNTSSSSFTDTEILSHSILNKVQLGLNSIMDEIRISNLLFLVLEELGKPIYDGYMSSWTVRSSIFTILKDSNNSNNFLSVPPGVRLDFLHNLLLKYDIDINLNNNSHIQSHSSSGSSHSINSNSSSVNKNE